MHLLHQTGLLFHIIGIFLIAGGSVGGLFVEILFWRYVNLASDKAAALGPLMQRLPISIQVGSILMLLSGLLMLGSVHWAYWGQWWFSVKMSLFVALFLNGLLVARPAGMAIAGQMRTYPGSTAALLLIRTRLVQFHVIQTGLLLALLGVSVFRF